MLIGYVSDERYVALADVVIEFVGVAGSFEARSRATGSVHVDAPPGTYRATLQKPGFGSKTVTVQIGQGLPLHHFRLLSDCLLGYAWPKCVRSGKQSEFRVHSVEPYRLSLWRYGLKRVLVRELGWHDEHGPRATMQITPDGDYSRTGVEWNRFGYTSPHHRQFVEAPDWSGLYYFRARTASGADFSFPWIVAPARPTSPIAVLASNITWNAYNSFGGRSNYINPDALPSSPTINSRQDLRRYTDPDNITYGTEVYAPLSMDRPEPINHINANEEITDPIEGRAACHIAPAEWRLLGWLEREGFAYDYYSETQLHHGVLNLDDYKVLIISTHPEYWSREMYFNVKSWVNDRGGKLLYLGGNGLNCEVVFPTETSIVYLNGDAKKMIAGGYESRFHMRVESEANLLGVVFTDPGVMTSSPYEVLDDTSWIYEGTGLKKGDLFGEKSLHMRCPGGASGHETDKVSPSSPPNIQVLAKGKNVDNGGAEIVHYETPSGGAVFSVGSITWPSSILLDDAVSRITANVLNRFLPAKTQTNE